jgi:hypothetical protein
LIDQPANGWKVCVGSGAQYERLFRIHVGNRL